MKIIKEERGITLIALVITIIVLLILAGVSINAVIGENGIATKAKNAKEETEKAAKQEEKEIEELLGYIEENEDATSKLSNLTNNNIGDYIDLGNNIIGTEKTTDDWRILYKDETRLYVILADYLPAKQVPTSAGLNTDISKNAYWVWSNTNKDTLLNGLKNETAWSNFTNGITGATAIGAPTVDLLLASYNIKNGTELVCEGEFIELDSSTEDYDLYVPHTEDIDGCSRILDKYTSKYNRPICRKI